MVIDIKKEFDQKRIQELIYDLLIELGDDPTREGLLETPSRAARMLSEVLEGMRYTNSEIAEMFGKTFSFTESNDLVMLKDIEVFSFCEHHLALIYNMRVHVGYIPNKRVIGLSKIARIADMAAKRLQLQERLCCDIADILEMVLDTENVMVIVEGEHSCITTRGIKSRGATTKAISTRGRFADETELAKTVYSLL